MRLSPTFFDCAESALLVDFGPNYNKVISLAILDLSERLQKVGLPGLIESVPALCSLTVFYNPLDLPRHRVVGEIEALCQTESATRGRVRTWEIPVAYGGPGGPDLEDVALLTGLSPDELMRMHTEQLYYVYMLGFLPGFAYLGGLPDRLRLPRRSTPRARVPVGSLAIGSDMTAIYPLESPGGWHLIGYTPVLLWDMARREEPLLKPGDLVRFKAVSEGEAAELRQQAAEGWHPNPVAPA